MTKDSKNIKPKIKQLLIVFIDVTGIALALYIQPSQITIQHYIEPSLKLQ
jgi:hypothetical protein